MPRWIQISGWVGVVLQLWNPLLGQCVLIWSAMDQYQELQHKAAGHDGTLTDSEGLLVFKPTVRQEVDFYKAAQQKYFAKGEDDALSDEGHGYEVSLAVWMPTFLGILEEGLREGTKARISNANNVDFADFELGTIESSSDLNGNSESRAGSKCFIVLENLLKNFVKPNVLDIKLGKVLYDETASDEKRDTLTQVSANTTSGSLGIRICGMKLQKNQLTDQFDESHYQIDDNDRDYVFVNKQFGRSCKDSEVEQAFNAFFANDNLTETRQRQLKEIFLQRLQLFYNTLLDEEVRMISSSLLFIYEGDTDRWDELNDEDRILKDDFIDDSDNEDGSDDEAENRSRSLLSSMSLIDFAHSKFLPGKGYDENVVVGVESVMSIFENLTK